MKFGTVYADPPWEYRPPTKTPEEGSLQSGYSTSVEYPALTTDELCRLPVAGLARDDAVLALWTTVAFVPDALRVMGSWGFEYKTSLSWTKTLKADPAQVHGGGVGSWFRGAVEYLFIGVRPQTRAVFTRRPGAYLDAAANAPDGLLAPKLHHSAKPDCFYDLLEAVHFSGRSKDAPRDRLFPEPRLELFARRLRDGWTQLGNELPGLEGEDIRDGVARIATKPRRTVAFPASEAA